MKGVRIIGLVLFSGIFALGSSLIGYRVTDAFLHSSLITMLKGDMPFPYYTIVATVGLAAVGAMVGFLLGSTLYRRVLEVGQTLRKIPAEDKIAVIFGTFLSLIPVFILDGLILWLTKFDGLVKFALIMLLTVLIIWLGNIIALSMKEEMKFFSPRGGAQKPERLEPTGASAKILDTNVIIDGRIYDICRSGFLEGTVILPGFVLEELQHIADSADPLRRNRGRRGLDILYQMQKELETTVRVMDRYKANFAAGDGVDIKLVKLAKSLGSADLVTNDYNLNKVAKLHGVRVLNVNELANALKPIVLPGEEMTINLVREGKEYNQGVGYLDDGTMVVVEGGKRLMGETVSVTVSSVLQTVAGKMIFAELSGESVPARR